MTALNQTSSTKEPLMKPAFLFAFALILTLGTSACTKTSDVSYKDSVHKALEQADLKGISVAEDKTKNTITLSGKLHSEDSKQQANQVAQAAAGSRIVANEISVEPVGLESQAKEINSNLDEAIEKNFKAALIAQGLDKQNVDYKAKNGLLTLKGQVKSMQQRQQVEQIASAVPNVAQVLNQIEVRR
jgi:osmotically-inducible protein OsmY